MIKDILVNLSSGDSPNNAGRYAISIAEAFGAHVAGVSFAYEPVLPASVMGGIAADVFETQRKKNEAEASKCVDEFERSAKRAGLSVETHVITSTIGGAADLFSRLARRFDLAVIPQVTPDTIAPDELLMEAALFESGRPVIIVPFIHTNPLLLDRVICCWDGSRAAARAIGDAIPLLMKARAIELLTVSNGKLTAGFDASDMTRHLVRHGLKVEAANIPGADVDVANTILNRAADSDAQLIVMGGYGHSRLREYILGGATRGILATMTVPVLMAH
jgi:nucleotide-binding universal stress UspA family protein